MDQGSSLQELLALSDNKPNLHCQILACCLVSQEIENGSILCYYRAMIYRGYSAKVEYDAIDKIFVGHLTGIRDIASFHGSTVEELESTFREAVHHYLEVCERLEADP